MKKQLILTPYQSSLSPQANKVNMNVFKNSLKALGIEYTPLMGCWNGETEPSFLVDYDKDLIDHVFNEYGQEAVLVIDTIGHGSLLYSGQDEVMPLGKKRVLTKDEVSDTGCWTYDYNTKEYFIFGEVL